MVDLEVTFATLSWKGWVAISLVLIGFICMLLELTSPDFIMLGVLAVMAAFQIMPVKLAISGFSSPGLLIIIIMFVVAEGLINTGGIDWAIGKMLGRPKHTSVALVRMMVVTMLLSSWVNNTPLVCIMMPIVITWASKYRLDAKQILIPLSYSALLGGVNTLIGTTTNVFIASEFNEKVTKLGSIYYVNGTAPISLFSTSPYAIPVCVWGAIYMVLAAPFLLPHESVLGGYNSMFRQFRDKSGTAASGMDDYFVGLVVSDASPIVDKTVEEAGLDQLDDLTICNVRRHGRMFHVVGPDFVLEARDVLFFSGFLDRVTLLAARLGLQTFDDAVEAESEMELGLPESLIQTAVPTSVNPSLQLVRAVVSPESPVVGRTIRDLDFRSSFNAAVVAIKRNGQNIEWGSSQIGDEQLQANDTLLLNVSHSFWTNEAVKAAFAEVSKASSVKSSTEFLLAMVVYGKSGRMLLAGKSIAGAGLRQMPGAFLVALQRRGTTFDAIPPSEKLLENDILWFAVGPESIRIVRNIPGLRPLSEAKTRKLQEMRTVDRRLVQVVVAQNSPIIGLSPKEVKFREKFNAVVVSIGRQGERIQAPPGEVVFRAGDVLLLDTSSGFFNRVFGSPYFLLVNEIPKSTPPNFILSITGLVAIVAALALYVAGILNIVVGAAMAAFAMIFTRCVSVEQARNAIHWDVVLVVAAALGVSTGMEASGASAAIANALIHGARSAGGQAFIISAVYLAAAVVALLVNSYAGAAIVFPIAAAAAVKDGIDPAIMAYAVMLGSAAVFCSSFGYQTNLIVQGAGGYRSMDFIKFGGPMQIFLAIVSIAVLLLRDYWYIVWIVTGVAGTLVLPIFEILQFGIFAYLAVGYAISREALLS